MNLDQFHFIYFLFKFRIESKLAQSKSLRFISFSSFIERLERDTIDARLHETH